jgi:hypothetical protein
MKIIITFFLVCTSSLSFCQTFSEKLIYELERKDAFQKEGSNGTARFAYVFKNNTPYGTNALVKYDDFYKTYSISFNKENGTNTSCVIKKSNFIKAWDFKYNGAIYKLTNYKN